MRHTAVWLMPVAWAMERVDQWVASRGASSRVFVITRSTSSSVMLRGLPGRGSSVRPSRRISAKRLRHLPTVARAKESSAAISPVAATLGGSEHDAAPLGQRLRALRPAGPAFEGLPLCLGEHNVRCWSAPSSHGPSILAFGGKVRHGDLFTCTFNSGR